MNIDHMVFIGIKRRVLAVDRGSGKTIWETVLGGSPFGDSFVNVVLDGGRLFAYTKGSLFCLDAQDGLVKWENSLPGCGYGIATVTSTAAPNANGAALISKIRQDEAAAAASS